MKLNIGCGNYHIEGYTDIDKEPSVRPDILRDIEKGLPFSDETIEEIFTSHTLEHINDLIFVLNEFHRVLKPGGLLHIIVPSGRAIEWALRDPTHKRLIFPQTFWYFCGGFPGLTESMGITARFKILKEQTRAIPDQNGEDYEIWLQK